MRSIISFQEEETVEIVCVSHVQSRHGEKLKDMGLSPGSTVTITKHDGVSPIVLRIENRHLAIHLHVAESIFAKRR